MERLTVRAERLAPEGQGLCRAEGSGRIVFVPHAVPGDRLEVEIVHQKGTYSKGRITSIISRGPDRIEPPCPLHFDPGRARSCGGCDWQQLGYEAQLRHKRELVLDCLTRIAKLKGVEVAPCTPSPQPWAYRNKVQVPFSVEGGRAVAGFYEAGSRRIIDQDACPVQPDLSVRLIRRVKALAGELGWTKRPRWLRHLFIRTNAEGKALAALVTSSRDLPGEKELVAALTGEFPELVSLYQNVQPLETAVILGPTWRRIWGAQGLEEKLGRFSFLVSPGAFLQVNTPAAVLLYNAAKEALLSGGRSWETVADLYCGVGTLSLWVADAAGRVIGVEENREAVRDAIKNCVRNNVKNVRFYGGKAESVLPKLSDIFAARSAAIVDPPRSGLTVPVLRALTRPHFKRLVYVSCDPASFSRDAGYLTRSGFRVVSARPFDLFPQTSHVELVALLDRS